MLPLRIARRYLFSRKSHSVINLISGVSLVAVAVPVAAMIILLSVFNGFEGLIRSMASTFDADLTITPREGSSMAVDAVDTTRLKQMAGVKALGWMVEQEALACYGERQTTVIVRGVEEHYLDLLSVKPSISSGSYRTREGDYDYATIGRGLSYELGIRSLVAAPLTLYALRPNSFSTLLPIEGYKRRELPIAATFQGDAESEGGYVLTSLRLARELFSLEGKATALQIRTTEGYDTQRLRKELQQLLGKEFEVRTRYELKQTFYQIMVYEKWGIFFISLLVLIVASFSIVGALTMLIIEKRNEIETLRAIGADTRFIRHIFQGEGWLIGLIGGGAGTLIGVGITYLQASYGVVKMPVGSFTLSAYPVEFRWGDLVAIWIVFAAVVGIIGQITVRSMIPVPKEKPPLRNRRQGASNHCNI